MVPRDLTELLLAHEFNFITGVPDSIFKDWLIDVNNEPQLQHVITNNEGEACALATGYHLATNKIPVIYMQNSGLGNSINPLTSLLDAHIYAIPALLLIAWRGFPGEKDEPQHIQMGKILPGMCALLNIDYMIADSNPEKMQFILQHAQQQLRNNPKPYAILFPKSSFAPTAANKASAMPASTLTLREQLLEKIIQCSNHNDIIITTTGKTSREMYEIRERLQQGHAQDFLTVGSMGCASSIALGIAMQRKTMRVILIDGDGACLMRLEALATIGHIQPANLLHIVIDNNAYESTGSQKTLSHSVDFVAIAHACQYQRSLAVNTTAEFQQAFNAFQQGPMMLVVKTHPYSRQNLGRPKTTPLENKQAFMQYLGAYA